MILARALVLSTALACGACGRRATHEDCQLIVNRSVELEMKESGNTDAVAVQERQRDVQAELSARISACETERRVTDPMMACVRGAQSSKELDDCLR